MSAFDTSKNNKRIAKNTVLLYIRMVFLMLVTLYTSRVVLEMLGVTDFGIYNVVGGVVSMLGFLSGSLSGATSRFITFELGKEKDGNVKLVFRCAVTVHYIIALAVFILAETIGLWFVVNKLVIPADRYVAAMWVYQCSVISFIVSILSVPYNALIIAHERMNAFAYISIFDASARLLIVFLLGVIGFDHLIVYAILLLIVQIIVRIIYTLYCVKYLPGTSSKILWDKQVSREILVYGGWTMNGYLATICYTQGINILLNLFFGPIVNAARGIAVQVQTAVDQFFGNFQMAVRPQITKSYAQGNFEYMHLLMIKSSCYSFYLILVIALPILINTDYILHLWLKTVPDYSVSFTRLMILTCMCTALKNPTLIAVQSTGKLKKFQLIEGSLLLTILPLSYLMLKFYNVAPESVLVLYLCIEIFVQFVRVWIVYPYINLSKKKYFTKILYPICKVSLIMSLCVYFIYDFLQCNTFITLILNSLLCVIITIVSIFIFGINSNERQMVFSKLKTLTNFHHE